MSKYLMSAVEVKAELFSLLEVKNRRGKGDFSLFVFVFVTHDLKQE